MSLSMETFKSVLKIELVAHVMFYLILSFNILYYYALIFLAYYCFRIIKISHNPEICFRECIKLCQVHGIVCRRNVLNYNMLLLNIFGSDYSMRLLYLEFLACYFNSMLTFCW